MRFNDINYEMENRCRELRMEADHQRLLRAATPSLRQQLARTLRTWAVRVDQVRDARSELPLYYPEQSRYGSNEMSLVGQQWTPLKR